MKIVVDGSENIQNMRDALMWYAEELRKARTTINPLMEMSLIDKQRSVETTLLDFEAKYTTEKRAEG